MFRFSKEGNKKSAPKVSWSKIVSLMLVLVLIVLASSTNLASAISNSTLLLGDANADGEVNAIDVTKIERIIAGLDSPISIETRTSAIIVSSSSSQALGDFVCDGIADEVEIQAAIDSLPNGGGEVKLSEGVFVISATGISITKDNVLIRGCGKATRLRLVDNINANASIFTAVSKKGIVLEDLFLDGNQANQAVECQYGVDFDNVSGKIDCWADYFRGNEFRLVDCGVELNNRVIDELSEGYTVDEFHKDWTLGQGWSSDFITSDYIRYDKCYNLVCKSDGGRIYKEFTPALDLSSNNIQFALWIKCKDGISSNQTLFLQFYSGDDCWNIDFKCSYYLNMIGKQYDWMRVVLNKASAVFVGVGNPDAVWTSVNKVSVGFRGTGMDARDTYFGLLEVLPTPSEGILTITVDDIPDTVWTEDYRYLSKYGYKESVMVTAGSVDTPGNLTAAQINTLGGAGFDIGSHAVFHDNCYFECEAHNRNNWKLSQEWLKENFGDSVESIYFAAPGNALSYSMFDYFRLVRGNPTGFETIPPTSKLLLNFNAGKWVSGTLEPLIDKAVRYKAWLHLYHHGGITEEVVDYIHSSGLKVMTLSEVDEKYILKAEVPHKKFKTIPAKDVFIGVHAANPEGIQTYVTADDAEHSTFDVQPDYPRQISYSLRNSTGSVSSGNACTVTIKGEDARGYRIETSLSFSAGDLENIPDGECATKYDEFCFAKVISVRSDTAQPAGWDFAVGTREVWGLTQCTHDVTKVVKNGEDIAFSFNTNMLSRKNAWYHYVAVDVVDGDDIVVYYQTYED